MQADHPYAAIGFTVEGIRIPLKACRKINTYLSMVSLFCYSCDTQITIDSRQMLVRTNESGQLELMTSHAQSTA